MRRAAARNAEDATCPRYLPPLPFPRGRTERRKRAERGDLFRDIIKSISRILPLGMDYKNKAERLAEQGAEHKRDGAMIVQ